MSSVTYRDPAVALHATAFESLPQSDALLVGLILIRRKKSPLKRTLFSNRWCPRRDSNPHTLRHMDLNHARLPIPPRGLKEGEIIAELPRKSTRHCQRANECDSAKSQLFKQSWRASVTLPRFQLTLISQPFEPVSLQYSQPGGNPRPPAYLTRAADDFNPCHCTRRQRGRARWPDAPPERDGARRADQA